MAHNCINNSKAAEAGKLEIWTQFWLHSELHPSYETYKIKNMSVKDAFLENN